MNRDWSWEPPGQGRGGAPRPREGRSSQVRGGEEPPGQGKGGAPRPGEGRLHAYGLRAAALGFPLPGTLTHPLFFLLL